MLLVGKNATNDFLKEVVRASQKKKRIDIAKLQF